VNPKQARRVLGLVLATERPLTLKEMNIAFELLEIKDFGKKYTSEHNLVLDKEKVFQKKIENLCGFFLSIVDKRIYLIHQTAKEFLIKESSSTNDWSPSCWKHTFTLYDSYLETLKVCLWYLQLDFQDGRISSPNDDQLTQDHPLLLYASINWTLHFQQARERINKELTENTLQLCNTKAQKFLLWFRIFEGYQHSELPTRNINDLIVTSYFGLTPIVQLLLIGTSNINTKSKDNKFGQTLLRKDIELEVRDSQYSRTPLLWAAIRGHEAVVKLLLERGAELEAKDSDSRTPLLWATISGHEAIIKLLLERGAELEAKGSYSLTPLLYAALHGHEAVVKLLLERGAEFEAKDSYNRTPLLYAALHGHEAVVKLLLERGAELEAKDSYSRTPLLYAALHGHEAVVKLLLERGAELEAKDSDSRTPLS
jgi:ankyrin repeat protein